MAAKRDYYETLGVNKSADKEAIKKAYRKRQKSIKQNKKPAKQNLKK